MYFTVNIPIKIEGKPYRPCVCYAVTSALETTVARLVKEEKAELHDKLVFFCNGKILERKPEIKQEATVSKKAKKDKKAPVETVAETTNEETEDF